MDSLSVFAAFSWSSLDSWVSILYMAIGLGTVIFVHELGHFAVAKMCGVKCEKFYVGFDVPISIGPLKLPPALVKFQWGETEYGIGIIPLGGYVKMLGQDDNPGNAGQEAERIRVQKPAENAAADSANNTAGVAQDETKSYELDPRSYPAKSVPRRMAIISAGVIMNLITGGIFAMVAYRMGVAYMPCQIGDVMPGGAAWRAGIQTGDKIIQIGRNGQPSEKLRYDKDLSEGVLIAGTTRDLPMLVRRVDGSEKWFDVRPLETQHGKHRIARIGVTPLPTLTLDAIPSVAFDPANPSSSPVQPRDHILAVNGKDVASFAELQPIFAAERDQPVTLKVERQERLADGKPSGQTQTVEVTVQPTFVLDFGMSMRPGPVEAIRPGSPAEKAGITPGDEIVSIAGEPLEDPMNVDARLRPHFGQEIALELRRKGQTDLVQVHVTPEIPTSYLTGIHFASINSIGVAYPVYQDVVAVAPESPAAKAGVQPGDRITEIQYLRKSNTKDAKNVKVEESLRIEPEVAIWPMILDQSQGIDETFGIRFIMARRNELREVEMIPVATKTATFGHGLRFGSRSEIHQTDSNSEAFWLGIRELKESSGKVLLFLHRLVTGEISVKHLGGPGTIAVAATAEASQGLPRLLIFLTLLSANLAVMNFLPIPVLDGGHMMFLLAEWRLGRPVDELLQYRLTLAGFAIVLGLMCIAIGMDIGRFTGWWG